MTTLIINPDFDIQKNNAFQICYDLLDIAKPQGSTIQKQEIQLSSHPDFHLINGAMQNSIGIDEIRELLHKLKFQPYQAPFQLGVILNAQALTIESQNALLKSLEEPGIQTRFILTIQNEKQLLPTILSRAQKFYSDSEISKSQSKKSSATDTQGSSESKLETLTDPSDEKIIANTVQKISKFLNLDLVDQLLAMEILATKEKDSPDTIKTFLTSLLIQQQYQLKQKLADKSSNKLQVNLSNIRQIYETMDRISHNANKRLALENLILKLEKSIM